MSWSLFFQLIILIILIYLVIHALIQQYFSQVRETEVEVGKALRRLDGEKII